MALVLSALAAGVFATTFMTLSMVLMGPSGFRRFEFVRALGAWFSNDYRRAMNVGLTLHFVAGTIFAFLYAAIFRLFGLASGRDYILGGGALGALHGFVFSFWVIVLIAEHHPFQRFRRIGFTTALVYGFAHVIFGVAFGLGFWWLIQRPIGIL